MKHNFSQILELINPRYLIKDLSKNIISKLQKGRERKTGRKHFQFFDRGAVQNLSSGTECFQNFPENFITKLIIIKTAIF